MILRFDVPDVGFIKEFIDISNVFLPGCRLAVPDEPYDIAVKIIENIQYGVHLARSEVSGAMRGAYDIRVEEGTTALSAKRLRKRAHKLALYYALREATGMHPPWGSLTGVRPTRLIYEFMESGMSLPDAAGQVREVFDISPGKASLLEHVVSRQLSLPKPKADEVSVYIGVPFCVSRCRYCSFVSRVTRDEALLSAYTDALCGEIRGTAALMEEQGLHARSVYVGGGTPTALGEERLRQALRAAAPILHFAREITVEAGRPDTLDAPMLRMLREEGATRLCVNPQTMDDATLARIGRAHTARQTDDAFRMARDAGFAHINMDLIAGLPGEDDSTFHASLSHVLALHPESVTVHALCVKRSSDMHRLGDEMPDANTAQAMVDGAREMTARAGYAPYYLYRQKHIAGNQENVGYARPGHECLYNVDMMEDAVTVLAMGAGAITRRVWPGRQRILRAPNVKDIQHYIARAGEMLARKQNLMRFGDIPLITDDERSGDVD